MKNRLLCAVLVILAGVSVVQAADLPDRNSARIDRLERIIDGLEQRVRQLESGRPVARKQPGDPLLGNWQCTNGIQTRNLTFLVSGQVVIEETPLGNISKATWTRLDADRISIAGSVQYEIHFYKVDEFELTEVNRRSTGTCRRQP